MTQEHRPDPTPPRKRNTRWVSAVLIVATAVLSLAVVLSLFYLLDRPTPDHHDHEDHAEAAEGEQMYTCSMHPQVRMPDPDARCPICGMELIPVETEEEEDDDELPRLRLTRRSEALMQVQVQPAEYRDVRVPVRFYGRLDYDETRLRDINTRVSGWIEKLHVDFTGQKVERGQALFDVYSPELYASQQEYLLALDRQESGTGPRESEMLAAVRTRLEHYDITAAQISELQRRGEPARTMTIFSPHEGVVVERGAYEGMKIDPGMRVFRLADLSRLWVQFEAFERDLPWMAVGLKAVFEEQARRGESLEGEVVFIDPVVHERRRTARVRVEVDNTDGRLRPGSFVSGHIEATLDETPLIIPATAPLITGRRAVVYVQVPDQERPTYEARDVALGPRAGDWYIVREGLEAGDMVVVHGAFKIDSELQIRGRASMMQPENGRPPTHHHDHGENTAMADSADEPERLSVPDTFRTELGSLVRANFELVQALAADDADAVTQAARRANELMHEIDTTDLDDDIARSRWDRLAQQLHTSLTAVIEADDLTAQRRGFEQFSDALTEAVQAFGVQQAGTVYRAMCPMVEGREGFWLQSDRTITNPYFGASMLRCGEIVETLAESHDQEGEDR